MRPRVFIGSSAEGLDVAQAIQVNLDPVAEVELWSQGVFGVTGSTLESLLEAIERTDFAILVLQADDLVSSRGVESAAARDNVVFELGLFLGALGANRTAFVVDRDHPPTLPSDLAGITPATFQRHASGNLVAALGAACTRLRTAIEMAGPKPPRVDPASGTEIDRTYLEFHSRWRFEESPVAGFWKGVHQSRRVLRAEKPISRWTYTLQRRSDDDIPFNLAPPTFTLVSGHRTDAGRMSPKQPRHQSVILTVDIEFDPPLRVGEVATLEFEVEIPAHKTATLEASIDRPLPRIPVPGGGEYTSCDIGYRIEDFRLEVEIPRRLGAHAFGLQALAFGAIDHKEQSHIDAACAFSQELVEVDGEEVVVLALQRTQPPRKRSYRIHWMPPRRADSSC